MLKSTFFFLSAKAKNILIQFQTSTNKEILLFKCRGKKDVICSLASWATMFSCLLTRMMTFDRPVLCEVDLFPSSVLVTLSPVFLLLILLFPFTLFSPATECHGVKCFQTNERKAQHSLIMNNTQVKMSLCSSLNKIPPG